MTIFYENFNSKVQKRLKNQPPIFPVKVRSEPGNQYGVKISHWHA